jgi:hypothetical protein
VVTAAVSADSRGSGKERRAAPTVNHRKISGLENLGARERWNFPICELVENKERPILRLQKF